MEERDLKVLEETVDKELKVVDVYRSPITKDDISSIKDYFSKRKDLQVQIESGVIRFEDLIKCHYAIFLKVNGEK